jgi:hypothetical protein
MNNGWVALYNTVPHCEAHIANTSLGCWKHTLPSQALFFMKNKT